MQESDALRWRGTGSIVSTMTKAQVDAASRQEIREFGERVLEGGAIRQDEAIRLFRVELLADVYDLFSWANRIRERFRGSSVHLCSIVNIKAGACPEDCRFCAQSAHFETGSPRYSLIDSEAVLKAAEEARENKVNALGIVAAWRGLKEGPILDDICSCLEKMKGSGKARPDASLGIIEEANVAKRLRASGLECYNHNLETSQRFFSQVCSTHSYKDRVDTIRHLKGAGIKVCSGGILGMGETNEDRCELAFALRELDVDYVPINILNPIPGTPFENVPPVGPIEALKCIACFRFILPRQEILLAGGRAVNLRELQSLSFMAGASGMMVGNYLTTVNQPVEKDLQMLKDLGLEPRLEGAQL
jgi:biotin synthase